MVEEGEDETREEEEEFFLQPEETREERERLRMLANDVLSLVSSASMPVSPAPSAAYCS